MKNTTPESISSLSPTTHTPRNSARTTPSTGTNYHLCVKEKRYAAITRSDFAKLKEDLQFLDNALKTILSEYRDYFRERFVDGLSIRKYAEAHQLNRGSVDYLQKKFFSALARLLKERDEADGKCRLRKPAQN